MITVAPCARRREARSANVTTSIATPASSAIGARLGLEHLDALGRGEQRRLAGVHADADHQPVDEPGERR